MRILSIQPDPNWTIPYRSARPGGQATTLYSNLEERPDSKGCAAKCGFFARILTGALLSSKPRLIRLRPYHDIEAMTSKRQQQWGRWLLAALQTGRTERALELIRQGADLSTRSPEGITVLYAALAYVCFAVVKPLLEAGADPNTPSPSGTYPLHLAAEYGYSDAPQLLEALISHGARIDVRDEEGATAIFLARGPAQKASICFSDTAQTSMTATTSRIRP